MKSYLFPPNIKRERNIGNYVFWERGFDDQDIKRIVNLGESRNPIQAEIDSGRVIKDIRISNTSWIDLQEDSIWLFDRVSYIINTLNEEYYGFDLSGFYEPMQFTIYEGNQSGHYSWHLDSNTAVESPRKMSFVLQLSDPDEYEGGELQLMTSINPTPVKKEKGFAVIFPSNVLHRVTPVTKGIRRTLVVWATGPSFR